MHPRPRCLRRLRGFSSPLFHFIFQDVELMLQDVELMLQVVELIFQVVEHKILPQEKTF